MASSRAAPRVTTRKWAQFLAALTRPVGSQVDPGWDDLRLRPQPLPDLDLDQVRTDTVFLGHRLRHPVLIAALTGGHPALGVINQRLGRLAQRFGLGMVLGSQRAQLGNPRLGPSFSAARRAAPGALLVANIGAAQLVDQPSGPAVPIEDLRWLCDCIGADALAIHLNFLHEALQSAGDTRARGCYQAIGQVAAGLGRPVIVKETGAGLTAHAARLLEAAGVSALDVSGAGGSSMARLELALAGWRRSPDHAHRARPFGDWGVPAAASLLEVRAAVGLPVVAGGGIRSGVDAARALAAGADVVAVGLPLLRLAARGQTELEQWMAAFLDQLRTAMFLVGVASPGELRRLRPLVVLGRTRAYLTGVKTST